MPDSLPLISALMLTTGHKSRRPFTEIAIDSFLTQTYPNKELIIVNSGVALNFWHPLIREVHVDSSLNMGQLRNASLDNSQGKVLIQWDDDDWSAPERLDLQFKALKKGSIVLLKNQVRFDVHHQEIIKVSWHYGIFGTMLWEKSSFRFPEIQVGEDRFFVESFPGKRVVLNNHPDLYFRSYHGTNFSTRNHVMQCHGIQSLDPEESLRYKDRAHQIWPFLTLDPPAGHENIV